MRQTPVQNTFFESCAGCLGRVELLWVPGTEEKFGGALLRTLVLPVRESELLFLLGASFLTSLFAPSPAGGSVLGFALMLLLDVVLAVVVAHSVADPDGAVERSRLLSQSARVAVLAAGCALPAVLLPERLAPLAAAATAPALVGGISLVASGMPLSSAQSWSRVLSAAGGDLGLASLVTSATGALATWLAGVGTHLGREGVRFHEVLLWLCCCYLLFLLPRLSGLLIRVHGEVLGYGFAAVRQIPAMPGARGRGRSEASESQ